MTTFEKLKSNHRQLQLVYYLLGSVVMYECMYECMFAIGARNFEATKLKLGTMLGFHPEMVLANVQASQTPPPGRGRPRVLLEAHAA